MIVLPVYQLKNRSLEYIEPTWPIFSTSFNMVSDFQLTEEGFGLRMVYPAERIAQKHECTDSVYYFGYFFRFDP